MGSPNPVGEEKKERKGGAVPPWMEGAAQVGGGGGWGGAGTAAGKAGLFLKLKALMTSQVMVAATVVGGLALGGTVSFHEAKKAEQSQRLDLGRRLYAERAREEARAGSLPGSARSGRSGLSLASQANRGLYAPGRDAPGDEPAEGFPEVREEGEAYDETDAPPGDMDAAMLQEEGTSAKADLGRRFGQMSSSLGGGKGSLAGGSGLAGGIGKGFSKMDLSNTRLDKAQALRNGRGAKITRRKVAALSSGRSGLRGANARRLDRMNRAMKTSRPGDAEAGAAVHTRQWESSAQTGSGIAGAGASGVGEGGAFSSEEGVGDGGPVNPPSGGSGGEPAATETPPDMGPTSNATPYQSQIDTARAMLLLASVIITGIGILSMIKHTAKTTFWGAAVSAGASVLQSAMLAMALGLAAAAAAIGAMVAAKYGQGQQGTILMMGGAITMAAAGAAMLWPTKVPAWVMVLTGVSGIASSIGGILK
ncbi:MAG: hypothetical protein ABII00_06705 [Elusimicrobiota bacterium]